MILLRIAIKCEHGPTPSVSTYNLMRLLRENERDGAARPAARRFAGGHFRLRRLLKIVEADTVTPNPSAEGGSRPSSAWLR